MILWLSYIHNGISYTGKMTFYIESGPWSMSLLLLEQSADMRTNTEVPIDYHTQISHHYSINTTFGVILNGRFFVDSIFKFILLYEY